MAVCRQIFSFISSTLRQQTSAVRHTSAILTQAYRRLAATLRLAVCKPLETKGFAKDKLLHRKRPSLAM